MKKALLLALQPHLPSGLLKWFTLRAVLYAFDWQTQDFRKEYEKYEPGRSQVKLFRIVLHEQIEDVVEFCDGGWVLNYDRKETTRNGVIPRDVTRLRCCHCVFGWKWVWVTFTCEKCVARRDEKVSAMQERGRKKQRINTI